MDVDKPLDDLIADKRKSNTNSAGAKPVSRGGGRPSRDRREPVPYARPPPRSTEDKWVHDAYQGPGQNRRSGPPGGAAGGFGPGAAANVGFTGISPRIEVMGIHYEVTPADLKGIFSQAGTLVQGPTIRYDRSGRSTGVATMEYASAQQAKIAINKFDGAMTKGQTISIRLLPPVAVRGPPAGAATGGGSVGAGAAGRPQSGASLLARINKPAGGAASPAQQQQPRGAAGGTVRGRGGPARGRGAPAARGGKRGPADVGDLDKELDSFMKGDPAGDVAMA